MNAPWRVPTRTRTRLMPAASLSVPAVGDDSGGRLRPLRDGPTEKTERRHGTHRCPFGDSRSAKPRVTRSTYSAIPTRAGTPAERRPAIRPCPDGRELQDRSITAFGGTRGPLGGGRAQVA